MPCILPYIHTTSHAKVGQLPNVPCVVPSLTLFIVSLSVAASTSNDVQRLESVDMRIPPHNMACSPRRDTLQDMAELGTYHNTGMGPQDYAAELDIS